MYLLQKHAALRQKFACVRVCSMQYATVSVALRICLKGDNSSRLLHAHMCYPADTVLINAVEPPQQPQIKVAMR
jgi:hypothetical protein